MQDSKALNSIPLVPANSAAPAPEFPWPKSYTSAMFLAFDVDAESAWTGKDAAHAQRLVTLSYGGYEARVGVPKLLQLLDQLDLKATFFVTGWTVDAHPAMAESILKAGHEIGHHGYHHLVVEPGDPVEEELERGLDALKRGLGVIPKGYRAPVGEFSEALRVALARRGFAYSSSFRDDVRPYRHRLANGQPGTIELPVTASYDDWMHGLSNRFSPRSIFPKEHVLSIWKDELDEIRDWGAMVTTVLHPQCSGRPMRLRLLREFLTYAKSCPDLWIANGAAIAAHYQMHELDAALRSA
ncbi:polysaccharide deacetylase family protein [Tardiphaga sp. 215_C5_N2_1]|jgi:peptidoglycan/xylan/chitin deacetylase (PgdA/CDA1 family)|uniref:polysaccharide deacetylase family protein n=1 Tax=Tardiphaga sp. 215_C5_N2_1 TaxID=3240774 RepID=UPI003F8CEECC